MRHAEILLHAFDKLKAKPVKIQKSADFWIFTGFAFNQGAELRELRLLLSRGQFRGINKR